MTTFDARVPSNVHLPLLCGKGECACGGCATWQDGRRFGYLEALIAFRHYDRLAHSHDAGAICGVCDVVDALEESTGFLFPPGLPDPGKEARYWEAMMQHLDVPHEQRELWRKERSERGY